MKVLAGQALLLGALASRTALALGQPQHSRGSLDLAPFPGSSSSSSALWPEEQEEPRHRAPRSSGGGLRDGPTHGDLDHHRPGVAGQHAGRHPPRHGGAVASGRRELLDEDLKFPSSTSRSSSSRHVPLDPLERGTHGGGLRAGGLDRIQATFDEATLPPSLAEKVPPLLPDQSDPFSKGDLSGVGRRAHSGVGAGLGAVGGGLAASRARPGAGEDMDDLDAELSGLGVDDDLGGLLGGSPSSAAPTATATASSRMGKGKVFQPPALAPTGEDTPLSPQPTLAGSMTRAPEPTLHPHPLPGEAPIRDKRNYMQSACKSGTYPFHPSRTYFVMDGDEIPVDLDPKTYDFVVDYNRENVLFDGEGGVQLKLTAPKTPKAAAMGTRVSTVRYLNNARISANVTPITGVPGVITSFITMSKGEDEVDWEWVGLDAAREVETNVFYRGIKEYTPSHSAPFPIGAAAPASGVNPVPATATRSPKEPAHNYTIQWTDKELTFTLDGQLLRTVTPGSERTEALKAPAVWYPTEPSQVQFGVWDGGHVDPDNMAATLGTSKWAGGPIPWEEGPDFYAAHIGPLVVQCFDPTTGQPVDAYPRFADELESEAHNAAAPSMGAHARSVLALAILLGGMLLLA